MAQESGIAVKVGQRVTLETLVDRLGRDAAQAFFERVDGTLREGRVIHATNIRETRKAFGKARHQGQAQLVVPGRAGKGRQGETQVGDSVVIIKMDDFEAVVRAGQAPFNWTGAFAPRSGLDPAASGAAIVRGARGRRELRG